MALGWQEVRDEALRRIHAREWAPGDSIPKEVELADELGCARGTVNRALRDLAEAGWLERRRKAGTRVRLAPERRAQLAIPLIRQQVEAQGRRFAYSILLRQNGPLPARERALLEAEADTPAEHVQTLYFADGAPYALEDRWVCLTGAPGFAADDLSTLSPNDWLVQFAPFSHGTLTYSAEPADAIAAQHLDCGAGTPLMVLDRCTFGPEHPVTSVRVTHAPGHKLRLDI